MVSWTDLHLPCLVRVPWEAPNCQIGRTERSYALTVMCSNSVYTAHWETDKTFRAFSCHLNNKWRKYPVLNLTSKGYQSLENAHRGNFRREHLEQLVWCIEPPVSDAELN